MLRSSFDRLCTFLYSRVFIQSELICLRGERKHEWMMKLDTGPVSNMIYSVGLMQCWCDSGILPYNRKLSMEMCIYSFTTGHLYPVDRDPLLLHHQIVLSLCSPRNLRQGVSIYMDRLYWITSLIKDSRSAYVPKRSSSHM